MPNPPPQGESPASRSISKVNIDTLRIMAEAREHHAVQSIGRSECCREQLSVGRSPAESETKSSQHGYVQLRPVIFNVYLGTWDMLRLEHIIGDIFFNEYYLVSLRQTTVLTSLKVELPRLGGS